MDSLTGFGSQTSVKKITQRPDFSRTGQWEVVVGTKDGNEESHIFDAIICCSGHFNYPNLPLKDFPGTYLEDTTQTFGLVSVK